jgi:hypothetical protein
MTRREAGTFLDHVWDHLMELEFSGREPVNGTWEARQSIADARMRVSNERDSKTEVINSL